MVVASINSFYTYTSECHANNYFINNITFQSDLKCYWHDPTSSLSQRTTEEHTNATGTRMKGNGDQFDIDFLQQQLCKHLSFSSITLHITLLLQKVQNIGLLTLNDIPITTKICANCSHYYCFPSFSSNLYNMHY